MSSLHATCFALRLAMLCFAVLRFGGDLLCFSLLRNASLCYALLSNACLPCVLLWLASLSLAMLSFAVLRVCFGDLPGAAHAATTSLQGAIQKCTAWLHRWGGQRRRVEYKYKHGYKSK